MTARPWTDTSESLRRCELRRGEYERKFGAEGDIVGGSPYRGLVPAERSGLTAKADMPGDMVRFGGETGGSIGTGDSLRRANLTVL